MQQLDEMKEPISPIVPQTVYVVDDDPAARNSVSALVKSHGVPVSSFASPIEFLQAYEPSWHGCLVVDMRMDGMNGLEFQEELTRRKICMPVIVISGYADIPVAVRAMRNGAVSFLEKPCVDQELWQEVTIALGREKIQSVQHQRIQEIEINYQTLTPGELQVLEKILSGEPNKTIATDLDMGLRTVEMRRANILKKMHARSLAELVRLIVQIRPM